MLFGSKILAISLLKVRQGGLRSLEPRRKGRKNEKTAFMYKNVFWFTFIPSKPM